MGGQFKETARQIKTDRLLESAITFEGLKSSLLQMFGSGSRQDFRNVKRNETLDEFRYEESFQGARQKNIWHVIFDLSKVWPACCRGSCGDSTRTTTSSGHHYEF